MMKFLNLKNISIILCVVILAGVILPVFAENDLDVTFSAELSKDTVYVSDSDQTVTITLKTNKEVKLDGLGFNYSCTSPLEITAVASGEKIGPFEKDDVNLEAGLLTWSASDGENITDVIDLAILTVTIPANTPKGTYTINISEIEITSDYGTIWEDSASASATITVTEAPTAGGDEEGGDDVTTTDAKFTAELDAGAQTDYKVGDTITVDVLVGGTAGQFAASELKLTYEGLTLTGNVANNDDNDDPVEITDNNGTITIVDYGTSYTWADASSTVKAYTLTFTVNDLNDDESGSAKVSLTEAAFSTSADAVKEDLTSITVDSTKTFAITPADLTVTLPYGFTSDDLVDGKVAYGGEITIKAPEGHYEYKLGIQSGNATLTDNNDGTWTLSGIKENVEIKITETNGKTYTITFETIEHIKFVNGVAPETNVFSIQYDPDVDFVFTLEDDKPADISDGVHYEVISIKDASDNNVSYTSNGTTYTIDGENITGNIVIETKMSPVAADQFVVTIDPVGFEGLTVDYSIVGKEQNYTATLTLIQDSNYTYTVTYQIGTGDIITITNWDENNQFAITEINAPVTVTATKVFNKNSVDVKVTEYFGFEEETDGESVGKSFYLIQVTGELQYTYDGNVMYHSAKYNAEDGGAYVYLIIDDAGKSLADTVRGDIGIATGEITEVDYDDGDVNGSGKCDANDAQLAWDIYNATYTDFSKVDMIKFLRADMTGDGKIDVNDAAAVITIIQAATATN